MLTNLLAQPTLMRLRSIASCARSLHLECLLNAVVPLLLFQSGGLSERRVFRQCLLSQLRNCLAA